ncbi:hypothetical protein [Pseudomonas sp. PS02290]|uniref:hypothetical protein n=1 Tax=Pseudomonas sp. PS02290 TaxID=2991430 RepID=UPI00249B2011|nr:hypothetical protein [Pseudomonas sp. PS02290]
MKFTSLVLVALVAISSVSAMAEVDTCKKISGLAQEAMQARQDGDLLQDSMAKIGDGSKFAKDVVMKAYEKPVMTGKDNKRQAVREFQNEAYRVCYNANN